MTGVVKTGKNIPRSGTYVRRLVRGAGVFEFGQVGLGLWGRLFDAGLFGALENERLPTDEEAGGEEDADAEVGFVEERVGLGKNPVAEHEGGDGGGGHSTGAAGPFAAHEDGERERHKRQLFWQNPVQGSVYGDGQGDGQEGQAVFAA